MKYDTAVPIGRGATGEVFKAYDAALDRFVALKYLHSDDPEAAERLLREARLQARVDHESVCRVYHAGVDAGRPFIAMQYIEGATLEQAAPEMTLEDTLRVVRDVAQAVQAAHETGLVHRDLKPQNVMLERRAAGGFKVYVLDFGLARERSAPGLTRSGVIAGTPAYMAPEQARGQVRGLDARTDVYALGAILYRLLAGHPPFEGADIEVAIRVLNAEPLPLRTLVPSLPADLGTITHKCLEKDPERRYASAGALAADVDRFLRGEPLVARPPGLRERTLRRVRRRPTLAVAAGLVALGAASVGGVLVRGGSEARRRAVAALLFGQEVAAMESLLRQEHLLPLHDTRPAIDAVRARLEHIRAEMVRLGEDARGPGEYALGRGCLALDEGTEAREHLERAWQAGYRTPQAAYALGVVLGRAYRDARSAAAAIGDDARRAERLHEAEASLRDPAIARLREASSVAEHRLYVEGLIAYHEKRYDDAVARAEAALVESPGFYEALKLAGDAHSDAGEDERARGDVPSARRRQELAARAYRAAIDVARSDPRAYEDLCSHDIQVLSLDTIAAPARGDVATVLRWCEAALAADSKSDRAYALEALGLWRWGDGQPGPASLDTLGRAVERGQKAVALNPRNSQALNTLANAYGVLADHQQTYGRDSAESVRRAIESGEKALGLEPGNLAYRVNLAVSYLVRSDRERAAEADPRADLKRAQEVLLAALKEAPDDIDVRGDLSDAYSNEAQFEMARGLDPRPALGRAAEVLQRVVELAPRDPLSHLRRGRVLDLLAADQARRGGQGDPTFVAALAEARSAADLAPGEPFYWSNLADLAARRAELVRTTGGDPTAPAGQALEFAHKAAALDAADATPHASAAAALVTRALWEAEAGRGAGASLAAARREAAEAARLKPDDAKQRVAAARVELAAARAAVSTGRDPWPSLERAERALSRALQANASDADANAARAECLWRRAEWRRRLGGAVREDLASGLAAADRALAVRPGATEALALRAALRLGLARLEPDVAERAVQARRASDGFGEAFRADARLAHDYRKAAREARELAEGRAVSGRPEVQPGRPDQGLGPAP